MFPKIGVPQRPKMDGLYWKTLFKMDVLGVPLFSETSMWWSWWCWNPGQGGCNPSYTPPEKLTAGYLQNDGLEDASPASSMGYFFLVAMLDFRGWWSCTKSSDFLPLLTCLFVTQALRTLQGVWRGRTLVMGPMKPNYHLCIQSIVQPFLLMHKVRQQKNEEIDEKSF